MSMRLCSNCRAAENPLGRLRFKKFIDGKVYCENCIPANVEDLDPAPPKPASPMESSAGLLVVIPCPDCERGRYPSGVVCSACAGYGSVRIPANFLNVYRPTKNTPESVPLTEG